MARGTQLSVTLENKLGQLAKVAGALARAKVNIQAISVVDAAEVGVVRMVTSSNARAAAALKKAGMNVVRQSVIIAKLPNEVGALVTSQPGAMPMLRGEFAALRASFSGELANPSP